MKIYSVDSTESRENQKKIISKILPQVGLDLRHLRTYPNTLTNWATEPCADCHRQLNPYSHALLTLTKFSKVQSTEHDYKDLIARDSQHMTQ